MQADHTTGDGEAESSCHVSVMPDEIVHWLGEISPQVIVDGTYGGGGHARRLLEVLPPGQGHVIGLDRDPAVSRRAEQEDHDPRLTVFLGSYELTHKALSVLGVEKIDAMLRFCFADII